jgi:cytochrome P450
MEQTIGKQNEKGKYPPGPKGIPLAGSLFDFARDPLGFLQHVSLTYGDIAHFSAGPGDYYLLSGPEYIHQVLVGKPDKFQKEQIDKVVLGRVLGNGLLLNDGAPWRRQRRLAQPAFHTKRIQAYAEAMVNAANQLIDEWPDGEQREIGYEMMKVTLQIVARTLFDTEVSGEFVKVHEALQELQDIAVSQIRMGVALPEWLPLPMNSRQRKYRAMLDDIVLRIIRERRASGEDRGDLLSMLLMAQDEDDGSGMSDEQVRDEVMTIFLAGHETTATALTWVWYLLSQHPEAEKRLHDELDRVLGGRAPGLADLPQLKYAEMIVKETMRLYPPAWNFGRQSVEDIEIGGYTIRKGSTVFISPYVMHHHHQYFENPEVFDPERFSPENEARITKFSYIPFGAGPRVCIGNSFAMMEAQLILATIAQRQRLSLLSGQDVALEALVTLRPRHGIHMVPTSR